MFSGIFWLAYCLVHVQKCASNSIHSHPIAVKSIQNNSFNLITNNFILFVRSGNTYFSQNYGKSIFGVKPFVNI